MAGEVKSVCDLISRWAREQPDHPAILFGSRTVTYGQLETAATRIARILLSRHVRPGDLVPVLATRSCEMVASFLGVLKTGACYVPIDIEAWAEDHIVSTLKRVSARVVVNLSTSTYPEYDVLALHEIEDAFTSGAPSSPEAEGELPQASIKPMDLAYTIFTSGTTSTPKGVMIPHRALLNYVQQGDEEAPFNSCPRPEDRSLLTFSPGFDACAGVVFSTLCNGAQVIIMGLSEFESCAARATIIAVTPSMLSAIQDVDACSQLRLIIVGGEPPNQRLIQRWSRPGRNIYNGYGPTETTISSLMGRVFPGKPITLGRPMNNSRVLLLDGDNESDYGEMCITGPGLAVGYYQDEALTARSFIIRDGERMYRTGDFARRTEHGLEFAGRADSFIKNRGFLVNIDSQVIPILLEADAHTATAFKHRDRLVAFVTPEDINTLALRQNLLSNHNAYLVPDLIRAVPAIPLTANGKANNKALRQLLDMEVSDNGDTEEDDGSLHRHSKLETLKKAVSAATSLPQSEILDDSRFLDLGGNSLAALKVLSSLRRRHLKLRLKDLLDLPSLKAVSEAMQEDIPTRIQANVISEQTGPMTTLQMKMIQATLRKPGANYILLRIRIPHPGKSASTLDLQNVWQRVMSHHAIFRTNFLLKDELQKIDPDLQLEWHEEETTAEHYNEIVRARSHDIRDRILSSGAQREVFIPVNTYHLVTVEGVGSTLLISAHHAQADGWSFSIILDEVQRALLDKPLQLELPPQFIDIALFQRDQEKDLEGTSFWKSLLQNYTDLPTLRLPNAPPDQVPYEWTSSLKADLSLSSLTLGRAARALNVTPSSLFYAAWGLVLSSYTSSDHVAFGVVFSGRNIMEVSGVEHAVGPLLNTVPFPIEFKANQTIQGLASAINHALLQMLEFQWSATEAMASIPGESINRAFQTLVVTEYDLPPSQDLMSWSVEREDLMEFGLTLLLERSDSTGKDLHVDPENQELQARILFDSSRYAESGIMRLLNHFKNALLSIINPQHIHMKEVRSQLLTGEERAAILSVPSTFQKEQDTRTHIVIKTIKDAFELAVERWPGVSAIESPNGDSLSYREVDELANRVTTELIMLKHVRSKPPEDTVVGVFSDGSVHWVISILAVLKAGFICCPLDINLPVTRIQTIIRESDATLFLAANRLCQERLESYDITIDSCDMIVVDKFLQQPVDSPPGRLATRAGLNDIAYLVFTSGTTGIPKGVPLHNLAILNAISVPAVRAFAAPGRRISQLNALGFDMVMIELFGSLCYGATLVLKDPNNPFDHIKRVNVMITTPSFLSALLPKDYPNIDTVVSAGEPVTQEISNMWSNKVTTLLNMYGPSECGPCSSGARLLPGIPVTIGRPLPGLRFYILDHHQCLVPQGVTGEIYISGDQVTRGYWGNTNELNTKSYFIPDPFTTEQSHRIMYRTGDLGFWDEDLNISYVGRVDNQVKVRGFRVELEEIEHALIAAGEGKVQSAAAIAISGQNGAESDRYGLRIVGFVRPASVDVATLHPKLINMLTGYSRPSQILAVSKLPMTANLKVDREKLKALALAAPERQSLDENTQRIGEASSLSPTEKVIAAAWKKVLGLGNATSTIEPNDDFISLGGNSILAIKSAHIIAASIGHDVPIALLLRENVLGRLARAIDQQHVQVASSKIIDDQSFASYMSSLQKHTLGSTRVSSAQDPSSKGQPLSHLERELFDAQSNSEIKSAFNTIVKFNLLGAIDIGRLSEVFLALIQENPILRARYVVAKGTLLRLINADISAPQVFSYIETNLESLQGLVNMPFDLANDQLIRVVLWKQSETRTSCIIITHHIITDRASLAHMLEWTSRRYNDIMKGDSKRSETKESNNRPLTQGTYIDWARWLQNGASPPQDETHVDFWKRHLSKANRLFGNSESLNTQCAGSYASTRLKISIPPLSNEGDASAYTQRLAVAATALSLYANVGLNDAVLGMPYLNRDELGTANMLGLFVDRLPIRFLLTSMELRDAQVLLNHIDAEIDSSIEHYLPSTTIRSAIAEGKNHYRSLVDVMIIYGWQSDSLRHSFTLDSDVRVEDMSEISGATGSLHPLEIEFIEAEDGALDVEISYDPEIISPEAMAGIQALLSRAIQGLARRQSPNSILSAFKS
ncbi:hypothetical protein NPX13_g164 [Xylaria arbuscula]|uniref:Carrier domain-containing protein n=1 Tax=Xylaria arbuscula TaxID=114810 RepID=A0A9W8NNC7_9PEZI|nr:hypothetical protein NPX13_g164 [Xylaria arbuscula]